jgi:hypothetical protein
MGFGTFGKASLDHRRRTSVSTPGASIPIGVYRGRGCGIAAIGLYEDFIGREVQNVVDFMAEQPTSWAQFENGNLTSTADVSVWQNVLGRRQLQRLNCQDSHSWCLPGVSW